MKSTSLCFNISSVWKLVIKKEISYPYTKPVSGSSPTIGTLRRVLYLDWLPPQDEESLCSLCQEAGELVDQDVLNLVCLLDLDAYAHTVDAGLDEDSLVFVTGNDQGVQEDFGRGLGLNFGDIVSFRRLRGEVGQAEGGCETTPHALEVGAEGLRLFGR